MTKEINFYCGLWPLASKLLDSDAVSHKFIRDGQEVDTTELQELGITGFSLRAFVVPTRETYAKVIVPVAAGRVER